MGVCVSHWKEIIFNYQGHEWEKFFWCTIHNSYPFTLMERVAIHGIVTDLLPGNTGNNRSPLYIQKGACMRIGIGLKVA